MRITDKINLEKLYFGVVLYPMSWTSGVQRKVRVYNLFDSFRVRHSVATYVLMNEDRKKQIKDPLSFCFSDTRGRTEWEFMVAPWPYKEGDKVAEVGEKVDIYQMYVEPNRELLLDLVHRVTKSSAQKVISEHRKLHRR